MRIKKQKRKLTSIENILDIRYRIKHIYILRNRVKGATQDE